MQLEQSLKEAEVTITVNLIARRVTDSALSRVAVWQHSALDWDGDTPPFFPLSNLVPKMLQRARLRVCRVVHPDGSALCVGMKEMVPDTKHRVCKRLAQQSGQLP